MLVGSIKLKCLLTKLDHFQSSTVGEEIQYNARLTKDKVIYLSYSKSIANLLLHSFILIQTHEKSSRLCLFSFVCIPWLCLEQFRTRLVRCLSSFFSVSVFSYFCNVIKRYRIIINVQLFAAQNDRKYKDSFFIISLLLAAPNSSHCSSNVF